MQFSRPKQDANRLSRPASSFTPSAAQRTSAGQISRLGLRPRGICKYPAAHATATPSSPRRSRRPSCTVARACRACRETPSPRSRSNALDLAGEARIPVLDDLDLAPKTSFHLGLQLFKVSSCHSVAFYSSVASFARSSALSSALGMHFGLCFGKYDDIRFSFKKRIGES